MTIEKVKIKKKNSTLSRYLFDENNSGGYHKYLSGYNETDDKLKYNMCVVEAYSADEAIKIFEEYFKCDIAEDNRNSCECCWERFWYVYTDNPDKEYNDILSVYNEGKERVDETIEYWEKKGYKILYLEYDE